MKMIIEWFDVIDRSCFKDFINLRCTLSMIPGTSEHYPITQRHIFMIYMYYTFLYKSFHAHNTRAKKLHSKYTDELHNSRTILWFYLIDCKWIIGEKEIRFFYFCFPSTSDQLRDDFFFLIFCSPSFTLLLISYKIDFQKLY